MEAHPHKHRFREGGRQATTTTPIVTIGDALVQARLVASLAHPGGTITGVDTAAPDLVAKRMQFLKEPARRIVRVAGLRCPGGATPAGRYFDAEWREAETAAGALGLTTPPVDPPPGGRGDPVRTARCTSAPLPLLNIRQTEHLSRSQSPLLAPSAAV